MRVVCKEWGFLCAETSVAEIESTFKRFTTSGNVAVILINQTVRRREPSIPDHKHTHTGRRTCTHMYTGNVTL